MPKSLGLNCMKNSFVMGGRNLEGARTGIAYCGKGVEFDYLSC